MALLRKKAIVICLISTLVCSLLIKATEGGDKTTNAKSKLPATGKPDHSAGADVTGKCKKGVPKSECKQTVVTTTDEPAGEADDDDDDDDDDNNKKETADDDSTNYVVLGH